VNRIKLVATTVPEEFRIQRKFPNKAMGLSQDPHFTNGDSRSTPIDPIANPIITTPTTRAHKHDGIQSVYQSGFPSLGINNSLQQKYVPIPLSNRHWDVSSRSRLGLCYPRGPGQLEKLRNVREDTNASTREGC
jgi:hypothetical protein